MTTDNQIDTLFNHLDEWRGLPAYQLERRADIFFSLYLKQVIQTTLSLTGDIVLIPEFPCRKGSVYGDERDNHSFKIDYLVLCETSKKAFFVELKTDMAQIYKKQEENMLAACKKSLNELIKGVMEISKHTTEHTKYCSLLKKLKPFRNWDCKPQIIYITPKRQEQKRKSQDMASNTDNLIEITFNDFANVVKTHNDDLSVRFAESLERWIEPPGKLSF